MTLDQTVLLLYMLYLYTQYKCGFKLIVHLTVQNYVHRTLRFSIHLEITGDFIVKKDRIKKLKNVNALTTIYH